MKHHNLKVAFVFLSGLLAIVAMGCELPATPGGSSGGGRGGLPTPTPGTGGPPNPSPTPTPTPDPNATPSPSPSPSPEPSPNPTPTPTPGVPAISCASNSDCTNNFFCDGQEQCINTLCQAGDDPCPSQFEECEESTQSCVIIMQGCVSDVDCEPDERCDTVSGVCQPQVIINCGPGAGACNIANFSPGCEVQACCNDICLNRPSCCTMAWDSECAAQALSRSTCLAGG